MKIEIQESLNSKIRREGHLVKIVEKDNSIELVFSDKTSSTEIILEIGNQEWWELKKSVKHSLKTGLKKPLFYQKYT